MRLLLDNNLSIRLVPLLTAAGWDVQHVAELGLASASDATVLDAAGAADRVLVSADTDFGQLLARTHASGPSVVLIRRVVGRRVEELAGLLRANLPPLAAELSAGCVAAIHDDSVRARRLPIG